MGQSIIVYELVFLYFHTVMHVLSVVLPLPYQYFAISAAAKKAWALKQSLNHTLISTVRTIEEGGGGRAGGNGGVRFHYSVIVLSTESPGQFAPPPGPVGWLEDHVGGSGNSAASAGECSSSNTTETQCAAGRRWCPEQTLPNFRGYCHAGGPRVEFWVRKEV